MKKYTFILIAISLIIVGCGVYDPIQIVPDHIQTIRIDTIENNTQQIGLSRELTEEVINEFVLDGRLTVINSNDTNSVLKGKIVEYSKIPISYDENFIVEEYKLNIIVNLNYYDTEEEVKLWAEEREGLTGGIETWVKYYVGDDKEFVETEEEARDRLIKDTAKMILNRTVYGWE